MKYLLKKVITSNNNAKVFLAVSQKGLSSCNVILKTVLPGIEGAIHQKLIIAKLLNHPNIQSLIDFGEYINNNERCFYTCNVYVHGVYLSELLQMFALKKIKPPLPLVYHIICSICDALEYTQNFNLAGSENEYIPHGNICPDNILISYNGDVLLVNTGFADAVLYRFNGKNLLKNEHTVFSHPDVCNGKPWEKKYEFYSVGMLLFCMLAGIDKFISLWDQFGKFSTRLDYTIFPQISQSMHHLISSLTLNNKDLEFPEYHSMKAVKMQIQALFLKFDGNEKELCGLIIRALYKEPDINYITGKKTDAVDLYKMRGEETSRIAKNVLQNAKKIDIQSYEAETEQIPLSEILMNLEPRNRSVIR